MSKIKAGTLVADIICGAVVMTCVAGAVAFVSVVIQVIEKL